MILAVFKGFSGRCSVVAPGLPFDVFRRRICGIRCVCLPQDPLNKQYCRVVFQQILGERQAIHRNSARHSLGDKKARLRKRGQPDDTHFLQGWQQTPPTHLSRIPPALAGISEQREDPLLRAGTQEQMGRKRERAHREDRLADTFRQNAPSAQGHRGNANAKDGTRAFHKNKARTIAQPHPARIIQYAFHNRKQGFRCRRCTFAKSPPRHAVPDADYWCQPGCIKEEARSGWKPGRRVLWFVIHYRPV